MSATLARLRKRAAEFEQKKQFDRALEVYVQILDEGGKELEDEDVPLFNRVGDMLMRQGSVTEALGYYERAVDMYAERGYLNNAIALCSKILRQSPGRAAVYYKLARISARKGFKSDARKNFLEYADRMQKLGMADEAFRALKEFASLYPDQDDVRLVLAELLSKENRKGEAIEQLQSLYDKLQSEGRAAEARATIDRMRAIDPTVTPREGGEQQPPAPVGDLVFLDLEAEVPNTPKENRPQPVSARAPMPTPVPALTGLSITFFPSEADAAPRPEGFESTAVDPGPVEKNTPVERSLTPLGSELVVAPATSRPSVPKLEAVERFEMIDGEPAESAHSTKDELIEDFLPEPPVAPPTDDELETSGQTPLSGIEFADLDLDDAPRESFTREHDLTLPGELPVTPDKVEVVSGPSPASEAASDDARAAAEEAAELAAEMVALEAAQLGNSSPPSVPTPEPVIEYQPPVETQPPVERIQEMEIASHSEVPERRVPEKAIDIPDDFMSLPPSFGSTSDAEEHAFPPLLGLDEAVVEEPAIEEPGEDLEIALEPEQEIKEQPAVAQTPPRATITIGGAEGHLRQRLELEPENWDLRRQLGEALLDTGDRDGGLYELELAMVGYELRGDLDRAQEVVDEILTVSPASVGHHQKRVEYAVRSRDRGRLTHSYLELADALFRNGAGDKAVAVYSRVLELDQDNERAEFALATLAPHELVRRRGVPARGDRWTDELAAIGGHPPRREAEPAVETPPAASVPDESTPAAIEPPKESVAPPDLRPAPDNTPVDSIELPDPDWGEGKPTPVPSQQVEYGVRHEQAQEPEEPTPELVDEPEAYAPPAELSYAPPTAELSYAVPATESSDAPPAEEPSYEPPAAEPTYAPPEAEESYTPEEEPSQTFEDEPLDFVDEVDAPEDTSEDQPVAFRRDELIETPPALRVSTPTPTPVAAFSASREGSDSSFGTSDSDFVDLGEWLRNTEPVRSTRMLVEDPKPTGDEQADFDELLRRFKRGVAENVEAEDYEAHYDLGVAYKEMGLIDEAIAQFQKSLRGPTNRVRSYEALGQCFVEQKQYPIAVALLQRATEVPGSDDQLLVGVLYLLGFATEHLGRPADALPYYLRVFAVDIEFRDVAARVAELGNLTK